MKDCQMPRRPQIPSFVGYARVSTLWQAVEGFSLDGQQDAIRAYAGRKGGQLIALCCDEKSGGGEPLNRPGLRDAINTATLNNSAILVTSVDRLARDLRIIEILVKRGIPVWAVNEDKLTRPELKSRLRVARDWHRERSRQATAANANRSPEQRKISAPNMPEARRRGTLMNMERAAVRDMKMFAILDGIPALQNFTRKNLALTLNKAGHVDIIDQSGRTKDWTERSVGRLKQRYSRHQLERFELDELEL
jgi:DNA invertase Pin-like site-specific DNA recombinase